MLLQQKLLLQHIPNIDVDMLEQACNVLRPLKETTIFMSSQTTTTASLVRPLYHSLIAASEPNDNDVQPIAQAKAALHHDLEKR